MLDTAESAKENCPILDTKAKTQSGTNPHIVMLSHFMYLKKEKYPKRKFSEYCFKGNCTQCYVLFLLSPPRRTNLAKLK